MTDNCPLVSIIMPCFNSSKTINNSINSVLKQSYLNWELIIIDDCSTDNSLEIIENYKKKDSRFCIVRNEFNKGVSFSRNEGLRLSSGLFIAFLDSDDFWDSRKLEFQISEMVNNSLDISCTAYYRVDLNKRIIGHVNIKKVISYQDILKGNPISMSSSIIKTEKLSNMVFQKVGHEDYLFWLNILKNGITVYPINSFLTYYTVQNDSLSSNKLKAITYTWKIYRSSLGFNLFKCFYLLVYHILNSLLKRI